MCGPVRRHPDVVREAGLAARPWRAEGAHAAVRPSERRGSPRGERFRTWDPCREGVWIMQKNTLIQGGFALTAVVGVFVGAGAAGCSEDSASPTDAGTDVAIIKQPPPVKEDAASEAGPAV